MKKEYKLSICMMIKNEEKNLTRCLESIKPIIDSKLGELIIVDTGSIDKSVDIARKYTDKIYFHRWNKNFSEMRNITISYAKGEWIFILDADEVLEDCEKLIKLMNCFEIEKFNSILLTIKNLSNNENENKGNFMVSPRIFRNDGNFRYEGAVHNQPIFKGPNLKVDINITHFGYLSDDKDLMERKFERTSDLLKNELSKDPNNLYYIYQLGVSYDMHGDKKESLEEFRKAYNILKNKGIEEKKSYIYIYGSYCKVAYTNNEIKESIKVANEALNLEKEYIDLYYLLAMSEKELGNIEKSFEYFSEYLNLVNRYNDLDISKNMSIIMYYIDDFLVSNAYFEIYLYYFNKKDYKNAYNYYKNIKTINQKIYAGINISIEIKDYNELRNIYDSLEDKGSFLVTLEDKFKNIEELDRKEIYKVFSLNKDIYGQFNKLRLINNEEEGEELATSLINKIDFNNSPLFYLEIFTYVKNKMSLIIKKFEDIEIIYLRNIIKELIEDENIKELFENYILKSGKKINNLDEFKVKNSISIMLMVNYMQNNSKISDKYLEIFKLYTKFGIGFISSIYQIEKAESIYKYINNEEDKFFMLMYLIDKYIKIEDKKTAIKYMLEVIHLNKVLIKYIEKYKDEIFKLEKTDDKQNINEEFENYKIKIKENIITLIDNKNLSDAKQIINEYEKLVKDDVEIYSMKAIIYTMEDNLYEAKLILEDGLRVYPENENLLYNLSYLLNESDFNKNKKLLN